MRRAYRHELFGASSEARHADQLRLFNEAEALATVESPACKDVPGTAGTAHASKRGRKPLDPNLPREVVWHELPESERFCTHVGHVHTALRRSPIVLNFIDTNQPHGCSQLRLTNRDACRKQLYARRFWLRD